LPVNRLPGVRSPLTSFTSLTSIAPRIAAMSSAVAKIFSNPFISLRRKPGKVLQVICALLSTISHKRKHSIPRPLTSLQSRCALPLQKGRGPDGVIPPRSPLPDSTTHFLYLSFRNIRTRCGSWARGRCFPDDCNVLHQDSSSRCPQCNDETGRPEAGYSWIRSWLSSTAGDVK